jgi:spore coat protein U-like protein
MKAVAIGCALLLASMPTGTAQAMTCTFTSVTGLAFGSFDVLTGASVNSAGSISYHCDDVTVSDRIEIQVGPGGSGSFAPRKLFNGAAELRYNIYLDPARQVIWGDGNSGTSKHGPVEPTNDTPVNFFGQIEPNQRTARAGAYSDTVVVTIVF